MDISGELMTFCVGRPRYFENNLLLENSPLWTGRNLAHDIYHLDIFRDCKYMYRSPLFRVHYEFPTNPSVKGSPVNDPMLNWWDIENRDEDISEDADDYGYVATQLMHLPKCIGYDLGNVLSYLPIYDLQVSKESIHQQKHIELTPGSVTLNFLCQSRMLPFKFRTNQVAVAQRDCLHDPSVYIINRKSLLVNKPHVFYNDDSSDIHCLPLVRNTLKWSEGFMGDCMMLHSPCQYEKPIRSIALNMDFAKVSLCEFDSCYYSAVPRATYDSLNLSEKNYLFHMFTKDWV